MKNPPTHIPTGTVTFLFTDIQGSTRMWERDARRMQRALARHDEILKGVVEDHEGRVFKMVGDACCAAFPSAPDALQAALAAQRAIFKEPWDDECRIRVRMALHTGEAEERGGDYFGPPLNRVARLLSAGHGGQTLLSRAACERVDGWLPEGANLKDMGERRLKDLKEPERIFQLLAPDLPSEFPPLKTLEAPSEDDRYRLIKQIGSGGMAEVYLAYDKILEREVAFKVLDRKHAQNKEAVERFRREARNAASLRHPNIVSIFDRGHTEDGTYYIVMEHMEGGTLEDLIQEEGPLSAQRTTEVALQVASALRVAHEKGVVHRDIKPQNILLSKVGEAKVADFGIARAASATTMTQAGSVMGTVHYISPEQGLGEPSTPRSDLYSLGVVLYEMLTGELPYDAETPAGVVMKHVGGLSRSPREANPDVPEELDAVVGRLLSRDPEERYPDAAALMEDLERAREGLPLDAATRERLGVKKVGLGFRRRGLLAALTLVVVSAGLIAVVALTRDRQPVAGSTADGEPPIEAKVEWAAGATKMPDSNPPKEVSLEPGKYVTDEFEPAFTVNIGKGWQDYENEQSDFFSILRFPSSMTFVNVQAVYDASNRSIPAPSDLTAWFERHPYLKTSEPTPVSVGGVTGKQFDVGVSGSLKPSGDFLNNSPTSDCFVGDVGCVPAFVLNANQSATVFYGGNEYRVTILDNVVGETVAIVENAPSDGEEFISPAEEMLSTVEWKGAG